jgi:hypothetical protein
MAEAEAPSSKKAKKRSEIEEKDRRRLEKVAAQFWFFSPSDTRVTGCAQSREGRCW